MVTSNPFAALARNLASSKLAATAIDRNLQRRIDSNRGYTPRQSQPVDNTHMSEVNAPAPVMPAPTALRHPDTPVATAVQSVAANEPNKAGSSFAGLTRRSVPISYKTAPKTASAPDTGASAMGTSLSKMFSRPSAAPAPAKLGGMFSVQAPAEDNDFGGDDDQYDDDEPSTSRSDRNGLGGSRIIQANYSDEQQAVIECNDRLIVVDAFAGCGKTATAVGYANHRPNERILYMCLNKGNATEAQARFGSNVTAATTHSVAWNAMKPNRNRICNNWKPMVLMDQMQLRTAREGMITMRVLADFFNSSDNTINENHISNVAYERDLTSAEVNNGLAFATLAWKRMCDPNDKLQMPHDAYLKMFALKAPSLNYSTIIFDEAQDANPVTLQIINGQKNCKLLCIGDRHQSIYQFRGSVNAMEKLSLGATHMHLSQTWRFGPELAKTANLILNELKGEQVPIKGMGVDGPWCEDKVTTLSRTNAELFRIAAPIRGEGVHWVGGVEGYRMDLVMDAFHLYIRERGLIRDDLMKRKFASWDEYVNYAEDASDGEAKVLVKVVEEFGTEIPQLIADIRSNAVATSEEATQTLSTAHKAKGLDWDFVKLSDDFQVLEKAEDILANNSETDFPIQDINLLYVGVTRAKKSVSLNEETKKWLEELPRHRNNREAAAARAMAILNSQRNSLSRNVG